jgi:hypothetical protein
MSVTVYLCSNGCDAFVSGSGWALSRADVQRITRLTGAAVTLGGFSPTLIRCRSESVADLHAATALRNALDSKSVTASLATDARFHRMLLPSSSR